MKHAFEILGYPSWHWISMAENPPDMLMWQEALETKFGPKSADSKPLGRPEFNQLLGHWSAITDQPAAMFAEELVNAYPEAKVVLVERDVDKWYKSFSDAVIGGVEGRFVPLAEKVDSGFLGRMGRLNDLITKYYFHVSQPRANGLFSNPEHFKAWRANARATYLAHNEMVKRVTPPDRLLLFQVDDGWEPLCKFLGKSVPSVPFPRVNESAALLEKMNLYIMEGYRRGAIKWTRRALPVLFAVTIVLFSWKLRYFFIDR